MTAGARLPVVVVGGGPVGLVTAIEARRAGFDVIVVEPRTAPIDKPCGEGIMPAGVARLRALGIDPPGAEITGITYAAAGRRVRAPFRHGAGLGVRRVELHAALHAAALGAGIELVRDLAVGIDDAGASVGVRLRSGAVLPASWVVGADGLHSRVRREVSRRVLHPRRMRRFGFVAHVPHAADTTDVTVHWCAAGEAYITPLHGDSTGIAILTKHGTPVHEVLDQLPDVATMLDDNRDEFSRGAGPFLQLPARRTRGRVLIVGDAAGYVDALTGEGLSLGFAQAHALVRALRAGEPAAYEREWWRASTLPLGLAAGLVGATRAPVARRAIVPVAAAWPWAFEGIVGAIAGSDGEDFGRGCPSGGPDQSDCAAWRAAAAPESPSTVTRSR